MRPITRLDVIMHHLARVGLITRIEAGVIIAGVWILSDVYKDDDEAIMAAIKSLLQEDA